MEPLLARSEVRHYVWPEDVAEALQLLVQHGGSARLVSGGTDVALHPPAGATTLVDVSRLPLSYIEQREGALVVGATTTLAEMLRHPLLGKHAGGLVPVAIGQIGSPSLRNLATVGGHLARGRLSDLVPALLALDAELRYWDGAERVVPLADFYLQQRPQQPIVITDVALPVDGGPLASGFVRFSRTAFDYAMLNCAVAVALDSGRITQARVAVGETPALARRVTDVEALLLGRTLDDDTIEQAARLARQVVITGDDQRASADYRSQLVHTGVCRCLRIAAGRPEAAP